jgi:hypothetical protein
MKKVLLSLLALCLVPALAVAQSEDCPGCEIGLYDTVDMIDNFGRFDELQKQVFLGVKFDTQLHTGLTGIEFSVLGLDPFFFTFAAHPSATVVLGDIAAPVDLSDETGGGMNMAFGSCQESTNGNFMFGTITMIALTGPGTIGDDFVLSILKKYPSTNPGNVFALFTKCDAPTFTAVSTMTGCYVINPTVGPGGVIGGCELKGVAVEESNWSEIKSLYR